MRPITLMISAGNRWPAQPGKAGVVTPFSYATSPATASRQLGGANMGAAVRFGISLRAILSSDIKTQEMRCAWRSATITISASGAASDVRCSENVEDGAVIDGRLRLANSCHSR